MPVVKIKGKKAQFFPYTKKGYADAKKAREAKSKEEKKT